MEFLQFLKEKTGIFEPRFLAYFAFAGLLNFVIILLIILSINATIDNQLRYFFLFCVAIFAYVRLQKYTMDRSSEMIETLIASTRTQFSNLIRRIPLLPFERIEQHPIHTLLTQEMLLISQAANSISNMLSSLTLMLIAFVYIGFVSLHALLITLILLLGGIQLYRIKRSEHERYLTEAREKENQFFDYINHMIDGFQEIKIHEPRNQDLFQNHILSTANETENLKIHASTKLNFSIIFAQIFSYLLLAFMIFIFPQIIQISQNNLIQVVTILLFVTTGPLQEIVGSFPYIERANISVKSLNQICQHLQQLPEEPLIPPDSRISTPKFANLRLNNVYFQYDHHVSETTFGIGPISLEVNRGEIIFLMGGNGAGKTTLIKVLTGLYPLQQGTILHNQQDITEHPPAHYRANFAAVFQSPHLFDRAYGIDQIDPDRVQQLLREMQIHDKTSIRKDGTITSLDLSMGQKKRLALTLAELENREIHVYDEWAADQDPVFRKYFYEVYLQNLVKQGKTIIAITHDDKYYGLADRIYRMDYGRLEPMNHEINKNF